jgi:hypothetical protein
MPKGKGIIRKIKLGSFKANFVIRHRWEYDSKCTLRNYEANDIRKNLQLGIWLKRSKIVGKVRLGDNRQETINKTFKEGNLINNYMLGLNLIVLKCWLEFNFKQSFGD